MSESEVPDFLSIEAELARLRDHLAPLKQEMEGYKSATQQLAAGREALSEAGGSVAAHGERMTAAADQAATALNSAAQALQPIGTTEIKAGLQTMQGHLDKTVQDIETQFGAVKQAAAGMLESVAATHSMPETITAAVSAALENLTTRLEAKFTEQSELTTKQVKALAAKIESLEQRLSAAEAHSQTQADQLMDAIEHSAPVGLFRKKRAK